MTKPLEQITVIELAGLGALPFAGMILAGMGADVLLVDRPSGPLAPDAMSGAVSRGKRSIVVDLKHRDAAAVMLRIVESADVLMEGFRPGVVERLGIGPDQCFAVNPELVYGRMTGWGRQGPYASMAGHDINYIAMSGALHAIGDADHPVPPLNLIGDYGGGSMYLVAGVLAALVDRDRSGGRVVEAAMTDGAASLMSPFYEMHATGTWDDTRASNLLDGAAPFYTTYATSDGRHMAVGALEPKFYAQLVDGLGLGEADLPEQLDATRWPELRDRFAAVFAGRTRADWEGVFDGTDACVTPVLGLEEAPIHDTNSLRGVFADHTGHPLPAPAPRFDIDLPGELAGPSAPGDNTNEILAAAGYDEQEVERLRADGVVA